MIHLVSPAFNEEESIQSFLDELYKHLPTESRIYIVDDGSKDRTFVKLEELSKKSPIELEAVKLSRNFGHQAAIHAGLTLAFERSSKGDFFIVLDSDLQHPPRLIPTILRYLNQGIHHVQMLREDSDSEISGFKKWTSSIFYKIFSWLSQTQLPKGGSDFRGFSYAFVESYLKLHEVNRFNRGLFVWMGFENLQVPYKPDKRFAGQSKYSFWKMLRLGFHGITQFSNKPLVLIHLLMTGFAILFCSAYLLLETIRYFMGYSFEPGWPTLVFLISFWGGLLAAGNLMTSLYIGLIFNEVKARPIYFAERKLSDNQSRK